MNWTDSYEVHEETWLEAELGHYKQNSELDGIPTLIHLRTKDETFLLNSFEVARRTNLLFSLDLPESALGSAAEDQWQQWIFAK
jgi:hypothetical protein